MIFKWRKKWPIKWRKKWPFCILTKGKMVKNGLLGPEIQSYWWVHDFQMTKKMTIQMTKKMTILHPYWRQNGQKWPLGAWNSKLQKRYENRLWNPIILALGKKQLETTTYKTLKSGKDFASLYNLAKVVITRQRGLRCTVLGLSLKLQKYAKNDSRTKVFYGKKSLKIHLISEERQDFEKWQNCLFGCKAYRNKNLKNGLFWGWTSKLKNDFKPHYICSMLLAL